MTSQTRHEELERWLEAYEQAGFCVVPLQPQDKRPIPGLDLSAYFTRRSVSAEHQLWWPPDAAGPPNNVGVVTGAISRLVVLDMDNEDAAMAAVEAMPWLEETFTVKTGKGFHFYVRPREADPGATTVLAFGGKDHHVKANHGYVVAPPSTHPSGAHYTGEMKPLVEVTLPALVRGLQSAGFERAQPKSEERPANWYESLFSDVFPEGQRNRAAMSLVGLLRHYIPDRPGLTLSLMRAWAQQHTSPPLTDQECLSMVRSYYRLYEG